MLSGNQKGLQSYSPFAEDIKKKITPRLGETDLQIRLLKKQPRAWG